jgi:superfamily II DNA or RNA helicase
MPKAVLSNRIYLEVTPDYAEHIKKELTYKIPSYHDPEKPIVIRNFSTIRVGLMSIPIGRTDLIPPGYEIVDKRIHIPAEFPGMTHSLRDSQQEIHDALIDNCMINAKPGYGKSILGLAVAKKLAQKTLVVVHTVPLRSQWAKEVEKAFGFEPGIIGSGKMNTESPIVIGNVQSLYNCIDQVQKSFGTIILDEMHHVSSNTFSKVVDRSFARYKIGLSGTLQRKDGKHIMFEDYFGKKIFKPGVENTMMPEVDVINSGIALPEASGWALRVNALMLDPSYVNLVMTLADRYVDQGHKVLVIADRIDFLEYCANKRPRAVSITGVTENREDAIKSVETINNEIWGTTSIFKEGISQNNLSTLILGTPINNDPMLEQLVGRIQRITPGKQTPRVVDIRLSGWTGEKQFQQRLGFYMRMGYKINYL